MADKTRNDVDLVYNRYSTWGKQNQHTLREMSHAWYMYQGQQWNSMIGSNWAPLPTPKNRVRITVNKLPAYVARMIEMYVKEKPIISATPTTTEESNRRSAKVQEILLRHAWDSMHTDSQLVEILTWVGVTGSCFAAPEWQKLPRENNVSKISGLPVLRVLNPFSLAVEPGVTRIEHAQWIIYVESVPTYSIEKEFNKKIEANTGGFGFMSHAPTPLNVINTQSEDRAMLMKLYERPNTDYPRGRIAYFCGDEKLREEPLPTDGYGRPVVEVVHFKGVEFPGEFYPTGIVNMMTPPQVEGNKTRSQVLEHRNYATRPILLATDLAFDQDPEMAPGGVMKYNSASPVPPSFLQPPMLGAEVYQIMSLCETDMQDVARVHDTSMGKASGSINSYKQANMAVAQDVAGLTPSLIDFQNNLSLLGEWIVANYRRNLSDDEIVYIVGKDRRSDVFKFNKEDISSMCNIKYDITSKLPWTKENTRQQAMWLFMQGVLDPESFKQIVDVPQTQSLYEFEQKHRENARLENDRLREQYFPPLPTDRHDIHIEEHKCDINLPEKRTLFIDELMSQAQLSTMGLAQESEAPQYPLSIQNLLQHIEAHQQAIPAPAVPAVPPKVTLSMDKLLAHPTVASNPQLFGQILSIAADMARGASGVDNAPPTEEAPEVGPSSGPSPPAGMSGELYSSATGNEEKL